MNTIYRVTLNFDRDRVADFDVTTDQMLAKGIEVETEIDNPSEAARVIIANQLKSEIDEVQALGFATDYKLLDVFFGYLVSDEESDLYIATFEFTADDAPTAVPIAPVYNLVREFEYASNGEPYPFAGDVDNRENAGAACIEGLWNIGNVAPYFPLS